MKICPRCGTENSEGTDFCVVCGEYLRWEPTRALDAVAPSDANPDGPTEEVAQSGGGTPSPVSPEPVADPEMTLPPGAAAVAPVRPDPVAVGAVSAGVGRQQVQAEA